MNTEQTAFPHTINPSFSGHQTFPFRYTWLKKGIDAVLADPTVFSSDEATVMLGVGKNMVASIRHWCRVAGLIEVDTYQRRHLVPTSLGAAIFADDGFDPYLDNPATLWLIHWRVTTNVSQATAWFWAFNFLNQNEFTRASFASGLEEWIGQRNQSKRPVSPKTLDRDVNCFIRTYCQARPDKKKVIEDTFDCPLVELNLIAELPGGVYQFHRGAKLMLPNEVVAATTLAFWDARFPARDVLPFSELMYAPLSPGRVFKLDEDAMAQYLDSLEQVSDGALIYDETANLKQVYRHKDIKPMELLQRYYG